MAEYISIPVSEYHDLLTRVGEIEGAFPEVDLKRLREAFEDESDYELERKRAVYRAWIVQNRDKEVNERRLEILTKIIKDRGKRRSAFEKGKETAANVRTFFQILFQIGGALAGVALGWLLRGTAPG